MYNSRITMLNNLIYIIIIYIQLVIKKKKSYLFLLTRSKVYHLPLFFFFFCCFFGFHFPCGEMEEVDDVSGARRFLSTRSSAASCVREALPSESEQDSAGSALLEG